MPGVSRILCPVDFSETSRHAFGYALLLAKQFAAELSVLHVVEATPLLQAYNGMPDMNLLGEAQRAAREEMKKLLAAHEAGGTRVTSEILQGPTYRTIVQYAKQWKADLVVVGTHGRGRLEYTFFGSVTERVMKSVECPVLVVRLPKSPDKGKRKK